MAGCGYTPDVIDGLRIDDVLALLRHWATAPPTHEILAAFLGATPSKRPDVDDPSNIGALIARHPDGLVKR